MAEHDNETPTFVRITNREIFDKIVTLEKIVQGMDERMNTVLKENSNLHTRVRALELKVYTILAGLVASLTAAGGWIITHA